MFLDSPFLFISLLIRDKRPKVIIGTLLYQTSFKKTPRNDLLNQSFIRKDDKVDSSHIGTIVPPTKYFFTEFPPNGVGDSKLKLATIGSKAQHLAKALRKCLNRV